MNYIVSTNLRKDYNVNWESHELKYLGVTLTKDLTKLFQINYKPLSLKIKEDLDRWSLIPFLSLTSRVNTIKMSVLPKLLYLFRTLPVEVPDSQFEEWDKQISRFIWQGKRPRIRYNTMQIKKEEGDGPALPEILLLCITADSAPLLVQ